MANPTAGEFLFDYLYDKGVTHAFGLPGDFALPLFRWLDRSKIKLITMTHEPSVGFAADGYARMKGLGVACVTYCVRLRGKKPRLGHLRRAGHQRSPAGSVASS